MKPQKPFISVLGSLIVLALSLPLTAQNPPAGQMQSLAHPPSGNYSFFNFDYPTAYSTAVLGVNDNADLVGGYALVKGQSGHGFLYSGGVFSTIDFPGSQGTSCYGINNSGMIVGVFNNTDQVIHGFVRQNGAYTQLDFPGAIVTYLWAINDNGTIAGFFWGNDQIAHGLIYSGGVFTQYDVPGSGNTVILGINDLGDTSGGYDTHGFIRDHTGHLTTVNAPGRSSASVTTLSGINASAQAVGGVNDSNTTDAFLRQPNGQLVFMDYPGATETLAEKINVAGVVVGSHRINFGPRHGYIAVPGP
jgi:hypothetical protein